MAPPSFNDLSKSANDLFSKDFTFGCVKADVKTKTASGVELKTSGNHNMENSRAAAELETKLELKDYGVTFTEKWKTSNVVTSEMVIEDRMVKGLKSTIEGSFEPSSGKKSLKVKNSFKNSSANVGVDLDFKSAMPAVSASGVFAYNEFTGGVSCSYSTDKQKLTKLSYGLLYQLKDYKVYGGVENGTSFSGSVYHRASSRLETGVKLGWASNTHFTSLGMAAKYQLSGGRFLKVKVDNSSMVGAAYGVKVNDAVRLTLCGNLDGKSINGGNHQLGLAVNFEQ